MLKKQNQARPKLTKEEKRAINAAIMRAKGGNKKEKSAQDTIPYQRMYPDGICRVIRLSVYNIERKELVNVDYIPTLEASGK